MLTTTSLLSLGITEAKTALYLKPLNDAMVKYGINTSLEISHFLAQLLHESGKLNYTKEIASGSAYEGRKDLGNTQPGDGVRFKGRGLIQLTGRSNYTAYGKYAKIDAVNNPLLLEQIPHCIESACWFYTVFKKDWEGLTCLQLSSPDRSDFIRITYIINGGFNGLVDRYRLYTKLLTMFSPEADKYINNLNAYMSQVKRNKPSSPGMRLTLHKTLKGLPDFF